MNETYQITVRFNEDKFAVNFSFSNGLVDNSRFALGVPTFVVLTGHDDTFTEEDYKALENGLLSTLMQLTVKTKSMSDYVTLVTGVRAFLARMKDDIRAMHGHIADSQCELKDYFSVSIETLENKRTVIGNYIFERQQMDTYSRMYEVTRTSNGLAPDTQIGFLSFSLRPNTPNSINSSKPVEFDSTIKRCSLMLGYDLLLSCSIGGVVKTDFGEVARTEFDRAWCLQIALWKFIANNEHLPINLRIIAKNHLKKNSIQS